jgi:sugar lactone lactonase YvrE
MALFPSIGFTAVYAATRAPVDSFQWHRLDNAKACSHSDEQQGSGRRAGKDMKELAVGQFEKVTSGIYLEGLAVDYQHNVVWYSDVIGGGLHRLKPNGKVDSFNPGRMWTGGVMLNEDGAVFSSGQGGIMWNHPDNGRSGWLVDKIDGQPINGINEMMPDGTGGIYFGTVDIEKVIAGQTTRPTAIYRLTIDRKLIKVADGLRFGNGMMLSADRKRFYCNDTFVCTYMWDVAPDLSLSNKRVLVDKDDVDGMALDAEANLWITGFRSSHLARVRPDGTELDRIQTPAAAITQIRFGGADMGDYYINAVPGDGGDSLKDGVPLTQRNSFIYRGRSEVPGMPIAPARFKLG